MMTYDSPSLNQIIPIFDGGLDRTHSHALALFVNGDMPEITKEFVTFINEHAGAILVDGGANAFKNLLDKAPISIDPLCCVGDLDSIKKKILHELQKRYPNMKVYKFISEKDFTDLEGALKLINISSSSVTLFNALGDRVDHMLGNLLLLFRQGYQKQVKIHSPHGVLTVFSPSSNKNPDDWVAIPLYEDSSHGILHIEKKEKIVLKNYKFPKQGVLLHHFTPKEILQDLDLILHCFEHPIHFEVHTGKERLFAIPKGKWVIDDIQNRTISLLPLKGPALGVTTKGLQWELNSQDLTADFFSISNIALTNNVEVMVKSGCLLCSILGDFVLGDLVP